LKKHFTLSEDERKDALFPKKHDKKNYDGKALVDLPPTPKRIQDVLKICQEQGLKVYTVVHKKGFIVSVDSKELKKWDQIVNDPIFCIDTGEYTVIMDYYGEIPEEEILVDDLKMKVAGITKEYLRKLLN
jgi:hypothetical protein